MTPKQIDAIISSFENETLISRKNVTNKHTKNVKNEIHPCFHPLPTIITLLVLVSNQGTRDP